MSSRIRRLTRLSLEAAQEEQRAELEGVEEMMTVDTPTDDIVELVDARQEADESVGYIDEVRDIHEELSDIREVSEVVNEKGGITLEAFAFFNMAIERICDRTGLEYPSLLPSLESFRDNPRVLIALEELDGMLNAVDDGTRRLETNSVEAIERLVNALAESIPNAHARIRHVLELVHATEQKTDRQDTSGMQVVFGDGLNIALGVNGSVPENLPSYLQTYLQLGMQMVGEYQTKAFEGAMQAIGIPDLLTYDTADGFWDNVERAVCQIEDPRQTLTDEQMRLVLPNGESLFGFKSSHEVGEDASSIVKRLHKFACDVGVNEQLSNPQNIETIPEGQPGYGRAALTLDEIRSVARNFDRLFECLDIKAFAERSSGIRQDMFSVVQRVKDGYASAEPQIKMDLTGHFGLLVKYLETVFRLADWPMLNYLSNLVFTTNAFVLYAERSLALPEGAVVVTEPVETDTETTEPESTEMGDAVSELTETGEKPSETLAEMREQDNIEDPDPAPPESVAEAEQAADPEEEPETTEETEVGEPVEAQGEEEAEEETEPDSETTGEPEAE